MKTLIKISCLSLFWLSCEKNSVGLGFEGCDGVSNSDLVFDECGICDGYGPSEQCWDNSIGCNISECPSFNSIDNELIISGANSTPDGVSGVFFTINGTINDPSIIGESTYLNLNKVRLNENELNLYEENYTMLILNGTMGDLNSDTILNILDLVITDSIVLEVIEPTDYQLWAADINNDGLINILDHCFYYKYDSK